MILKVFAIRDDKAAVFDRPFFLSTTGQAVRAFADACNGENQLFSKHPEDFGLFELGTYEDSSGKITVLEVPALVGRGTDYVGKVDPGVVKLSRGA